MNAGRSVALDGGRAGYRAFLLHCLEGLRDRCGERVPRVPKCAGDVEIAEIMGSFTPLACKLWYHGPAEHTETAGITENHVSDVDSTVTR